MKKAIYFRFIIIIIVTALVGGAITSIFFAIDNENRAESYVAQICKTVSYQYKINNDAKYLSNVTGGERITIIAPDGTVLDDSTTDAKNMENHLNRIEVQNAKEDTVITDKRSSQTLGIPYMYAAIKMEDGNIIRISHSYGGILSSIVYQIPIIFTSMIIVSILAIFIAGSFTKKIIYPLESFTDTLAVGNYDALKNDNTYYEIAKIIIKIKDLLMQLSMSQKEIKTQHDKINFILSNMEEGFILIDDDKKIRLLNNSAQKIFEIKSDVYLQSIITVVRNVKITDAVDIAINEHSSTVFDLQINDVFYSVHVAFIENEYVGIETGKNGVTILLVNVDTERKSQKQRSEFFANASHELKTPITSVMGFSEILNSGLVDKGEEQQIYKRMHIESTRMNNLIDDILSISRLESKADVTPSENVDIKSVIVEVVNSLLPKANALGVSINTDCEATYIISSHRQIYELINNLAENAIKYNKQGGFVNINVKNEADKIIITIADNGIGIPQEAQSRIFERFYRVDSGRSKLVGGTGLGLSIVKHIVMNLGGEIKLQSMVAEGTTITVLLPSKIEGATPNLV